MILAGNWHREPLPERPRNRDEAADRGFDPESIRHDRVTPEPLSPEWQQALDQANETVRHLRCGVEDCGNRRCWDCGERMTCLGPEPRACGVTCVACSCSCTACLQVREELRADLLHQIEREGRA